MLQSRLGYDSVHLVGTSHLTCLPMEHSGSVTAKFHAQETIGNESMESAVFAIYTPNHLINDIEYPGYILVVNKTSCITDQPDLVVNAANWVSRLTGAVVKDQVPGGCLEGKTKTVVCATCSK